MGVLVYILNPESHHLKANEYLKRSTFTKCGILKLSHPWDNVDFQRNTSKEDTSIVFSCALTWRGILGAAAKVTEQKVN